MLAIESFTREKLVIKPPVTAGPTFPRNFKECEFSKPEDLGNCLTRSVDRYTPSSAIGPYKYIVSHNGEYGVLELMKVVAPVQTAITGWCDIQDKNKTAWPYAIARIAVLDTLLVTSQGEKVYCVLFPWADMSLDVFLNTQTDNLDPRIIFRMILVIVHAVMWLASVGIFVKNLKLEDFRINLLHQGIPPTPVYSKAHFYGAKAEGQKDSLALNATACNVFESILGHPRCKISERLTTTFEVNTFAGIVQEGRAGKSGSIETTFMAALYAYDVTLRMVGPLK